MYCSVRNISSQERSLSKYVIIMLGIVIIASQPAFAEGFRESEIVIIPRPREITISKDAFDLDRATIVLESDNPTFYAAAQRINRAIGRLSGKKLPVSVHKAGKPLPGNAVLIGTAAALCKPFLATIPDSAKLRPKGGQAYSIRRIDKAAGTYVMLCGNTPVGSFYAAVTYVNLFYRENGRILARYAEVRDWPDWTWRCLTHGEYGVRPILSLLKNDKNAFVEKYKKWIDGLADYKINLYSTSKKLGLHKSVGELDLKMARRYAWVKPLLEYGRDRGVYGFFFVGSELAPIKGNENNPFFKGKMTLKGHYHCWSEDEYLRKKFRNLGRFMKEMGISFINIHYPDTGNENYQNRCEKCDKRFGADRASADANITNIMVAAVRESCPDAHIAICPHPYSPPNLRYKEIAGFLKRFHPKVPGDLFFTTRESRGEFYKQWNEITENRPLFVYYNNWRELGRRTGERMGRDQPLFATNVRFLKTFYYPSTASFLFCPWTDDPWVLLPLAEYAWNVDSPGGSVDFSKPPVVYKRNSEIPGEMVEEIYGRIARKLMGERPGRALTPFFRLPLFPLWVFQPEKMVDHVARLRNDYGRNNPFKGDLIQRLKEQAQYVRKGVGIVDAIVNSGMPFKSDEGRKIFIKLYKKVHFVDRCAPGRITYLEAKNALNAGDVDKARSLIARGLKETKAAEKGFESDLEKIKDWPQDSRGSVRITFAPRAKYFKKGILDKTFGEDLRKLKLALENPKLIQPRNVVPHTLAARINKTPIYAEKISKGPVIDGRLEDDCWKQAGDAVSFVGLVRNPDGPLYYPEAKTTVLIRYDQKNLYFAFMCEEPGSGLDAIIGSEGSRDYFKFFKEDVAEIFLRPDLKKSYTHMAFNVACRKFDAVTQKTEWGFRSVTKWNPEWTVKVGIDWKKRRWTAEVKIPFGAFRDKHSNMLKQPPKSQDSWRINLGRERRTIEYSASSVLRSFHEADAYRELIFK